MVSWQRSNHIEDESANNERWVRAIEAGFLCAIYYGFVSSDAQLETSAFEMQERKFNI